MFLVCAFSAAIYSYSTIGENYGAISNSLHEKAHNGTANQTSTTVTKTNTIGLFLHNLFADYQ
ncbi:hypothetical protein [uncultured Methanobrevibacter sp.]|uniref:hypothetical protein n=1 Tax=uncultured Methanobrevibacter sp. TaxID=253161 RepID=UPI0025ECDEF4|nr:hypothetical protein [uncultured Methanobrevibacter sp.]